MDRQTRRGRNGGVAALDILRGFALMDDTNVPNFSASSFAEVEALSARPIYGGAAIAGASRPDGA